MRLCYYQVQVKRLPVAGDGEAISLSAGALRWAVGLAWEKKVGDVVSIELPGRSQITGRVRGWLAGGVRRSRVGGRTVLSGWALAG